MILSFILCVSLVPALVLSHSRLPSLRLFPSDKQRTSSSVCMCLDQDNTRTSRCRHQELALDFTKGLDEGIYSCPDGLQTFPMARLSWRDLKLFGGGRHIPFTMILRKPGSDRF